LRESTTKNETFMGFYANVYGITGRIRARPCGSCKYRKSAEEIHKPIIIRSYFIIIHIYSLQYCSLVHQPRPRQLWISSSKHNSTNRISRTHPIFHNPLLRPLNNQIPLTPLRTRHRTRRLLLHLLHQIRPNNNLPIPTTQFL
jgi:hypothetical protein